MNTRQATLGGARGVVAYPDSLCAAPAEDKHDEGGKAANPAPIHTDTAGSPLACRRGSAPLSDTQRVGCRPRPYPARIRLTPPYIVTDGVIERQLTPHESILLFAVMSDGPVSAADLIEQLWPNPDLEPDYARSSLSRHMHDLRLKIAPFGWEIQSDWGFGFSLIKTSEKREPAPQPVKTAARPPYNSRKFCRVWECSS